MREAKIDKNGFLTEFQAFYTMMPLVLLLTVVLSDNSSKNCSALKKAPIIPIVIYKKPRFFHVTHIIVGDPMELTEYYGKKLTEQDLAEADNKVRDKMLELHRQHTEFLNSKKQRQ